MIIAVHAMDWSVNHCRPIAQQSAKIVTTRPTQRNTFDTSYRERMRQRMRSRVAVTSDKWNQPHRSLVRRWKIWTVAPRQSSFDFKLERQTQERADEHD